MASVTATSSIPPPAPLKLGTDVAAHWERFRSEWQNYETATELDKTTEKRRSAISLASVCLLYTSDAADDLLCVDLGGRRIIKNNRFLENRK